jgi:hypothetical protein
MAFIIWYVLEILCLMLSVLYVAGSGFLKAGISNIRSRIFPCVNGCILFKYSCCLAWLNFENFCSNLQIIHVYVPINNNLIGIFTCYVIYISLCCRWSHIYSFTMLISENYIDLRISIFLAHDSFDSRPYQRVIILISPLLLKIRNDSMNFLIDADGSSMFSVAFTAKLL